MGEKPKSIWRKSLKGWCGLLLFCGAIFATIIIIGLIAGAKDFALPYAIGFALAGFLIAIFVSFIRWLCCWRNFKRGLFGLVCFATLIALFYAEEDWRGKHDWEKFKREQEAKGERFDWQSIVPPPVPDAQNFAMAPIWVESMKAVLGPKNSRQWFGDNYAENGRTNFTDQLALNINFIDQTVMPKMETPKFGNWQKSELTDLSAWQNYYRTPELTNLPKWRKTYYPENTYTNGFPTSSQPQTPAQDVLLALSKYDSAIEELREAAKLPYARFPVYSAADHPFDTLLPHLAELKRCAQVLNLRAMAELQNGESEKALADVKLSLRVAATVRAEPFLISQLVRIAVLEITLQPVYEGLANHQWSDAQLVQLDSELAKLNFLADYEQSMRGERAASISALDYMRRARKIGMPDNGGLKETSIGFLVPSAFFYQNELTIARMHQQWTLPLVNLESRSVSPRLVKQSAIGANRTLQHFSPYNFFARLLFPAFENAIEKFAYAQSSVDMARVAIALERYRLAHGEFPESLDALAPKFITELPHDVIGGGPLQYRRTRDGQFVLYSIGWNERDDGGVVVFKKGSARGVDIDQGDWVWKYPAK